MRERPKKENPSNFLAKVPPQAVELEEAVLGALMLEKDALTNVIDILKVESFYKDSHKVIFQAIIDLFSESQPIDLLTVTNQLRENGTLEIAGGAFYVTELTSKVSSAANIEFHARIISERAIARQLINIGGQILSKAYEETNDVFELLDWAQLQLINADGGVTGNQIISLKSSMMEAFQDMARNISRRENNELTGIATPIKKLNEYTGGWQKGELIILAARPAMGKTALALAFARSAAKQNAAVAFFSLEMTHLKLSYRLIAQESKKCSVQDMLKGKITLAELNAMTMLVSKMTKYNINFDENGGLTIMALRAKAARLKAMGLLDMLIVDYLQLMADTDQKSNREQEIGRISRGLKLIAKDLDIPVIALSQLSRAVETRGGSKKPQLSDLRESGSIEQDADMVIFLYRPEYYGIEEVEIDDLGTVGTRGLAIGEIAKYRNGQTGPFLMDFESHYMDFSDYQSPSSRDSDWPTAKNL